MQGWGERRRPKKVPGAAPLGCFSLSPVHLCSLFKLPTPHPHPLLIPSRIMETDGVDFFIFYFFSTFPLRQSLENTSCLRACTFEAKALIFCAGEAQAAGLPSLCCAVSKYLGQKRLPRCCFNVYYLHVFVHVCMAICARV